MIRTGEDMNVISMIDCASTKNMFKCANKVSDEKAE